MLVIESMVKSCTFIVPARLSLFISSLPLGGAASCYNLSPACPFWGRPNLSCQSLKSNGPATAVVKEVMRKEGWKDISFMELLCFEREGEKEGWISLAENGTYLACRRG